MPRRMPDPLLAVAVALLAVAPAFGLTPRVKDEAGFFSTTAVKKADQVIREIKDRYQKDLLIETLQTVPSDRAAQVEHADRAERERFFAEWARERAREADINGVYVLICKEPRHVQVEVGNHTSKRAFTVEDRDRLRDILVSNFKAKDFDHGLLEGVAYVRDTLKDNLGSGRAEAGAPGSPLPGDWSPPAPHRPHFTLGPWIIVLLIVAAVGLLLFLGLISRLGRAAGGYRPGGGYPPPGPGYGGYGGYGGGYGYGGGGGGFFSSLFGSLFGAAAGNWVYDRFFRGGSPGYGGGGWENTAPQAPPPDASSQPDTDYSGSGGDFDDNAPADTGGGGELGSGDFYAGSGDGGGGDFGGGDDGGGGDGGDTGGGGDF